MQATETVRYITEPLQLQCTPQAIKPSLIDLINAYPHLSMIKLAQTAHIQIGVVHATVRGEAVQPVVAMQILDALWLLTGQRYSLMDIDLPLSYGSYQ